MRAMALGDSTDVLAKDSSQHPSIVEVHSVLTGCARIVGESSLYVPTLPLSFGKSSRNSMKFWLFFYAGLTQLENHLKMLQRRCCMRMQDGLRANDLPKVVGL